MFEGITDQFWIELALVGGIFGILMFIAAIVCAVPSAERGGAG